MRIIQHSAVTVLNKKRNSPVTPPFFFTKTTEFNSKNSPATLFFSKDNWDFLTSQNCVSNASCARRVCMYLGEAKKTAMQPVDSYGFTREITYELITIYNMYIYIHM
jgi:hypothetical protein